MNSNNLAIWCKELSHWKRPWCWQRLKAGGEGDNREWDGWMASPTWVWVNSGSWWWTGRPGVLQSMGSQRVKHDWATELNWTDAYVSTSPHTDKIYLNWRRKWQPPPVFLPGKSHGKRSLVGYRKKKMPIDIKGHPCCGCRSKRASPSERLDRLSPLRCILLSSMALGVTC